MKITTPPYVPDIEAQDRSGNDTLQPPGAKESPLSTVNKDTLFIAYHGDHGDPSKGDENPNHPKSSETLIKEQKSRQEHLASLDIRA